MCPAYCRLILLDTVRYYVISNIAAVLVIDILVRIVVSQGDIFSTLR